MLVQKSVTCGWIVDANEMSTSELLWIDEKSLAEIWANANHIKDKYWKYMTKWWIDLSEVEEYDVLVMEYCLYICKKLWAESDDELFENTVQKTTMRRASKCEYNWLDTLVKLYRWEDNVSKLSLEQLRIAWIEPRVDSSDAESVYRTCDFVSQYLAARHDLEPFNDYSKNIYNTLSNPPLEKILDMSIEEIDLLIGESANLREFFWSKKRNWVHLSDIPFEFISITNDCLLLCEKFWASEDSYEFEKTVNQTTRRRASHWPYHTTKTWHERFVDSYDPQSNQMLDSSYINWGLIERQDCESIYRIADFVNKYLVKNKDKVLNGENERDSLSVAQMN